MWKSSTKYRQTKQQYIKRIIHHKQVGFIPGMQEFFHICKWISMIYYIKQLKNKNHMTILIDTEKKSFNQIQHSFMIRSFPKLGIERTYLNIIKVIYTKPIANILYEKLFSHSSEFMSIFMFITLKFYQVHCLSVLSSGILFLHLEYILLSPHFL